MVKQSGSWYRANDAVITVVNLQKSDYSRNYYLNVAFWLKALGEEKFPKAHVCHVGIRLDMLLPDQAEEIKALLDLEGEVEGDRGARLLDLLETRLLPLLNEGSSVEGLRKWQREGRLKAAAVRGPAVPILSAVSQA
jgi:hypothetical protein